MSPDNDTYAGDDMASHNAEKVRRYEGWEFVGWLSALVPEINPADDVKLYRRREQRDGGDDAR